MDANQLAAQMRAWAAEFSDIAPEPVSVPDRFWTFLASRLAEHGLSEPDPDVVSINVIDGWRQARITGVQKGMLCYEPADGSKGWGLIPTKDVHPDDRGKLSAVLERFERDGKVGSGWNG